MAYNLDLLWYGTAAAVPAVADRDFAQSDGVGRMHVAFARLPVVAVRDDPQAGEMKRCWTSVASMSFARASASEEEVAPPPRARRTPEPPSVPLKFVPTRAPRRLAY